LKSGGLLDQHRTPHRCSIVANHDVAMAMGVDCTPFEGPIIPIIYNLNLRDPSATSSYSFGCQQGRDLRQFDLG
jgi:hypothetical protein